MFVVGLRLGWGARITGERLMHYLGVWTWESSRCLIEGRHAVQYDDRALAALSWTVVTHTLEFDLRDLETGRRYPGSLHSPYPPRSDAPEALLATWVGDMPRTEVDCLLDANGGRAYIEAESIVFVGLVTMGLLLLGGGAVALLVGSILTGREAVSGASPP